MTTVTAKVYLGSLDVQFAPGQLADIAARIEGFVKAEYNPGVFDLSVEVSVLDGFDEVEVETDDEWDAQHLAASIRQTITLFPWWEITGVEA